MQYNWTTNIRYIQGVGPVKAEAFAKIGVKTVGDLLEYKPSEYIYPGITHIADLHSGTTATVSGVVVATHIDRGSFEAVIRDESGDCHIKWYNQAYLRNKVDKGMVLTVWGRTNKRLGFDSPNFTTCSFHPQEVCGGTYGTHTALIRPVIREILEHLECPKWIDSELGWAFYGLHFPESKAVCESAIDYLKRNELLVQQVAMAVRRREQARQGAVVIE